MSQATPSNRAPLASDSARRSSFSTVSVVALVVLAAIAATCAIFAADYRRRLKAAEARAPLPAGKNVRDRLDKATKLNEQERKYLEAVAARYGFRRLNSWTMHDLLMLTARLNQELNQRSPAAFDAARTPWLLPMPPTLPGRWMEGAQTLPLDLASGKIDVPGTMTVYQYTVTNTSGAPAALPILYRGVRWDSAEALVETSGLRGISDEVDRALGVWRFVAEHRCHGQPVTEGSEEHDLIKYLACHGYGFCDDSAQAVVALAEACGLKARIRGLNGHVVPELFAGGRWRMFDADFAVCFHTADDPRAILGLEELEKDRAAFAHPTSLGASGPWQGEYAAPFLSREDNKEWPVDARRAHAISHMMQPGESVTFSNFNWGRYFLGAYPHKPPRYYNGCADRSLELDQFALEPGVKFRREGAVFVLENTSTQPAGCSTEVRFPFPIVGGRVSELAPGVAVEMVEGERRVLLPPGRDVKLDSGVAQLCPSPTYAFTLRLQIPAGHTVKFEHAPRLTTDFQFAEFALLKLARGANTFELHGSAEGLKAELRWR